MKSLSFKRLQLLETRFNLHTLLNQEAEIAAQKSVPHRDFYNVRKVQLHEIPAAEREEVYLYCGRVKLGNEYATNLTPSNKNIESTSHQAWTLSIRLGLRSCMGQNETACVC